METFCDWTYVFPATDSSSAQTSTLALNETGTRILKLLFDQQTEHEIARVLSHEYRISFRQSLAAVKQFQQQLQSLHNDS